MADAVAHRGPDDAGVWIDREAEIALAYRRLAVIDPSPAGRQPMRSASGRSVIVFNGEIYNHLDLRRRIAAQRPDTSWRGHSDTETLLAAIEHWGLEEALQAANGMFAFAFWDREDRTLCLARDRMGEKPLYYGRQNGVLLFGSELKALAAHPAFEGDVDRDALTLLLRHGYISSPWSIYKGVRKLPAGAYVKVAAGASRQPRAGELPEPQCYWSLRDIVAAGRAQPFEGAPEDAVDALHDVLLRGVRGQMAADVPLGAFLSGGIDSSTVVALMQAQSGRPVRTFTIGFDESEYNEAEHAKAVAGHLGTEHTELYVSARDSLDVIPRLPDLFDEPFADSSQIPTFLVAGWPAGTSPSPCRETAATSCSGVMGTTSRRLGAGACCPMRPRRCADSARARSWPLRRRERTACRPVSLAGCQWTAGDAGYKPKRTPWRSWPIAGRRRNSIGSLFLSGGIPPRSYVERPNLKPP